nr:hypothetical protein [Actinomadura sp. WAC 06369]
MAEEGAVGVPDGLLGRGLAPRPQPHRAVDRRDLAAERLDAAQPLARVGGGAEREPEHLVRPLVRPPVEQGPHQLGAVLEVPVEAALGDAQAGRERVDRHAALAGAGQFPVRGLDPVPPGRLRAGRHRAPPIVRAVTRG